MNIWLSHVTVWEQTTLVISVKSHYIPVSLLIIVHASLSFTHCACVLAILVRVHGNNNVVMHPICKSRTL